MEAKLLPTTYPATPEINPSPAAPPVPLPSPWLSRPLARLSLFALVLGLDCLVRSSLPHAESMLAPLASFGIATFAVFFSLGYPSLKALDEPLPFRFGYFAAHLASIAALCAESAASALGHPLAHPAALVAARIAVTLLAVVCIALACLPLRTWFELRRKTGFLWLYAVLAGALAWALRAPLQSLWTGERFGHWLQIATFAAVKLVLQPLLPGLRVDAPNFILSAPNFAIFVAQACSGLEGLGLVLVFTTAWLAYFRKENRFPHALALIPCALAAVWTLNVLRICALMLIGNAGAPKVAMVGFHSQAGWIAFTAVSLAFSVAARRLSWVRRMPAASAFDSSTFDSSTSSGKALADLPSSEATGESPATGAFLLPFLAILAASFVSKAASGDFEWAYPLRFVAAAIVLWHFRAEYAKLNFRFGWRALLTGIGVFLIWIAPTLWAGHTTANPTGESLAALSPAARWAWIVFRIAAAVLTVPLAEELAFRGYIARRFITRDFDELPFRSLTWLPIALSSVAFGVMHGRNWPVGILAGLAFALLLRSKGRFGDAVAAHATANLLLAVWVLSRGDWAQW